MVEQRAIPSSWKLRRRAEREEQMAVLKHHGAQGGRQWKGTSAGQHRQGSRLEIEQPGTWGRVTGEEDEGGVLCQAPLEGEKRETWLGAELTTGKLHGEQHRARERAPAGPREQRQRRKRARQGGERREEIRTERAARGGGETRALG